jgi:hypothetical protein
MDNNALQRGMTSGVAELLDFSSVDWSPHSLGDAGGRLFWRDVAGSTYALRFYDNRNRLSFTANSCEVYHLGRPSIRFASRLEPK